jgi:hypothetical protein
MEHGIEDTKTNLGGTPTTFFDCLDLTSLTPTLRKVGAWVCMGEFEILAVGILWRISCAGSGKARACHCLLPAKTTDRYAWRRDASLLVEVTLFQTSNQSPITLDMKPTLSLLTSISTTSCHIPDFLTFLVSSCPHVQRTGGNNTYAHWFLSYIPNESG